MSMLMQQSWLERGGNCFGARPDNTGPIGGGEGYKNVFSSGDFQVSSVTELADALMKAEPGNVVFIEDGVELELTDWVFTDGFNIKIPAGVTLAGSRGVNGSAGALIYSDEYATDPLIEANGPGVRISGLRIQGPDPKRRLAFHYRVFIDPGSRKYEVPHDAFYRFPNSNGIVSLFPELQVDNCEISAWSHGGISLRNGSKHHIHHNFIHHCQRMGLGYGIVLAGNAEVLIDANLFQDNKHHIAGTGEPGMGYEACRNIILPYTESHPHPVENRPYGQDHLFDMHGGRDRRDGTDIAGSWLNIHHNTFYPSYVPVKIRGVPQEKAEIHHNWFAGHDDSDSVVVTDGNTKVFDNLMRQNST